MTRTTLIVSSLSFLISTGGCVAAGNGAAGGQDGSAGDPNGAANEPLPSCEVSRCDVDKAACDDLASDECLGCYDGCLYDTVGYCLSGCDDLCQGYYDMCRSSFEKCVATPRHRECVDAASADDALQNGVCTGEPRLCSEKYWSDCYDLDGCHVETFVDGAMKLCTGNSTPCQAIGARDACYAQGCSWDLLP